MMAIALLQLLLQLLLVTAAMLLLLLHTFALQKYVNEIRQLLGTRVKIE